MNSPALVPIHGVEHGRLREAVQQFDSPAERSSFLAADPALLDSWESFEELRRSWLRGEQAQDSDRPAHLVPASRFVLVDGGQVVAKVDLRHRLTEPLRLFGGHIGYTVVPAVRGQGYGPRAFELTLPVAERIGLATVLITCHYENEASRRIIAGAGGVLVDQHGERLRYVVSTGDEPPETDIDALC